MFDIGNILKTTSISLQREKLTIGECKDERMVAIEQFTLLLDDGGNHRTHTVSNADQDKHLTQLRTLKSDITPSSVILS